MQHGVFPKTLIRPTALRKKRFVEFCLMNRLPGPDGDVLPTTEGTLVCFASHLARTVRHSTIKLYLAAVRNLHITSGHDDPLKGNLLLRKVQRGILRYQGDQRIRRQPVTPEVLLRIYPVLKSWPIRGDFLYDLDRFQPGLFCFPSLQRIYLRWSAQI